MNAPPRTLSPTRKEPTRSSIIHHRSSKHAFSLVELSIVLVILGLLTGGILAGQSLIRAAELRNVPIEYSRHLAAIQTFRDKYMAIPGDMANATLFWGARDGNDGRRADCTLADVNGTATCNGDGNGQIGYWDGSHTPAENFLFWQHLANAGLIEGSYTGKPISNYYISERGINEPASRIASVGWSVGPYTYHEHTYMTETAASNKFWMGAFDSVHPAGWTTDPFLTPSELWNIDTKMDDGRPMTGLVRPSRFMGGSPIPYAYATGCTNATYSTDAAANYNLGLGTQVCAILFERLGSNLF